MIIIVDYCVNDFDVFFFKQKTAYEMRISDWSSDVCSSDLIVAIIFARHEDVPPFVEIVKEQHAFSGTDEPLGVDDGGTVKAQFADGIERGFEDNRAASRGAHLFAVLFVPTVEQHQPVSGDR